MRGDFDDVPLAALFPFLAPADADSLNQTANTVDAARAGRTTADWEWVLEPVAFAGSQPGMPIVLGLVVIEHAAGGDQLEFLLQVVRTGPGQLVLEAAVNVACWCETDHAAHDVDNALRLPVGEAFSWPDASWAGVERPTGLLTDPQRRRPLARPGEASSPTNRDSADGHVRLYAAACVRLNADSRGCVLADPFVHGDSGFPHRRTISPSQ
ncbi:hypothetical protein [Streptomyces sp. NPDC004435]|uniref:hypothetical protein n=1 Tax=Streptomyces sp. NPDC004435 TaxID=3364701 RepID=UPI00368FB26C